MYAHAHCGVPAFPHMQVADAVGDENCSTWIGMLADRMRATDWEERDTAEHMLCSLLCLPPHLLHAVLTSCIEDMSVSSLLDMLPAALHSECMSAAISVQTGDLDLFELEGYGLDKRLMHLRTAAPPPPGLISLCHCDNDYNYEEPSFTPATSALLARALAAHTTLQKLDLMTVRLDAEWLTSFSLCLATITLPQLTSLEIDIQAAGGGCAALARCLKHLPTLHELHVGLLLNEPPPSHPGQSALTVFAGPAACPATLSHLEKLAFYEIDLLHHGEIHDGGSPRGSCILQLLPLFTAPALSTVSLMSDAGSISHSGLVAALAVFPALRTVDIEGSPHSFGSEALMRPGEHMTSLKALCFRNRSGEVSLKLAAMMVRHASASLTSLHLNPSARSHASSPRLLSDGWDALLGSLAACNQLQSLHLGSLHGMSAAAGAPAAVLMIKTFEHLTGLTELCLGRPGAYLGREGRTRACSVGPLCGEQLARALRCVPRLERLSLEPWAGIDLQGHKAQAVLDACVELPCLRELELKYHGFEIGQIATALTKLRALTLLELSGARGADAGVVAALRAQFPGVTMR